MNPFARVERRVPRQDAVEEFRRVLHIAEEGGRRVMALMSPFSPNQVDLPLTIDGSVEAVGRLLTVNRHLLSFGRERSSRALWWMQGRGAVVHREDFELEVIFRCCWRCFLL